MPPNFEDYKERIIYYIKRVFAVDFDEKDWVVVLYNNRISLDNKVRPEIWCLLPYELMDNKVAWEEAINEDVETVIADARKDIVNIEQEKKLIELKLSAAKDNLERLVANK